MLDFTSAVYLGINHSSKELRPWARLTTGRPAALDTPMIHRRVANDLAKLVGCERASLGPSTLHLFWDLFGLLRSGRSAVYVDAGAYQIARWGVERTAARGTPMRTFSHHDPDSLEQRLERDASKNRQPLVVTDGFCPGCRTVAPLAAYQKIVQDHGGLLIIDDTQALGVLGQRSRQGDSLYGQGGGGSLRFSRVFGPEIVVINSLAKGFGAPLAMIAGSRALVSRFEAQSATRVHCSPPSMASVHAAQNAIVLNRAQGDGRRSRLARLVQRLRERLALIGIAAIGGLFPIQTLQLPPNMNPAFIHRRLLDCGIRTVLHRVRCGFEAAISFLLTALHRVSDIDHAVRVIAQVLQGACASSRAWEKQCEHYALGSGYL